MASGAQRREMTVKYTCVVCGESVNYTTTEPTAALQMFTTEHIKPKHPTAFAGVEAKVGRVMAAANAAALRGANDTIMQGYAKALGEIAQELVKFEVQNVAAG